MMISGEFEETKKRGQEPRFACLDGEISGRATLDL
jgi:hypothetical protein